MLFVKARVTTTTRDAIFVFNGIFLTKNINSGLKAYRGGAKIFFAFLFPTCGAARW